MWKSNSVEIYFTDTGYEHGFTYIRVYPVESGRVYKNHNAPNAPLWNVLYNSNNCINSNQRLTPKRVINKKVTNANITLHNKRAQREIPYLAHLITDNYKITNIIRWRIMLAKWFLYEKRTLENLNTTPNWNLQNNTIGIFCYMVVKGWW